MERYYDAETGRFISEDPIGFAGGDLNLYAYVQNNPVLFVDPWGLDPGDPFHTKDEAGIDAILFINPTSISEDIEYGGWVFQNLDSTYSYTNPNPGGAYSTNLGTKPSTGTIVGDYHTHAAYKRPSDEYFSLADEVGYSGEYNTGYLGTPSGAVKRYNATTGDVTTLIHGNTGNNNKNN